MGSPESTKKSIVNNGSSEMPAEMKEKEVDGKGIVTAIAAGGLGMLAYWGVSKLFGSDSQTAGSRKMMKAPGRDYKIYRDDFERDPSRYFRELRK